MVRGEKEEEGEEEEEDKKVRRRRGGMVSEGEEGLFQLTIHNH